MRQRQFQGCLQAVGRLLASLLLLVRDRVIHQQLLLDDVVGRQCPFATPLPEPLLQPHLGLSGLGQVVVHLVGAEADEVVDPVLAGGVLAIQRQVVADRKHQPGTPVAPLQAAVAAAVGGQFLLDDVVLVAAHAGNQ